MRERHPLPFPIKLRTQFKWSSHLFQLSQGVYNVDSTYCIRVHSFPNSGWEQHFTDPHLALPWCPRWDLILNFPFILSGLFIVPRVYSYMVQTLQQSSVTHFSSSSEIIGGIEKRATTKPTAESYFGGLFLIVHSGSRNSTYCLSTWLSGILLCSKNSDTEMKEVRI